MGSSGSIEGTASIAAGTRARDIRLAIGLSTGATVALGFSRFAYSLLLPAMRTELGWSFAQAGALNTANGIGYIGGALLSAWSARRWGLARAFQYGLLASSLLILLTPATSNWSALILIRIAGGFATALAFVLGAALAGGISTDRAAARSGFLVGIYVAGASAGITISGIVVPVMLRTTTLGWRAGWLALGILAVAVMLPAWAAARTIDARVDDKGRGSLRDLGHLTPTILGYGLFGAGYAGFMTFVIAFLQDAGGSHAELALFWIVLGLTSTASTLLWGRVLGRFSGGAGPAIVFGLTMLGTLPLLLWSGAPAAYATAVIFGCSVMAGPTAITVVAKQQLPAVVLAFAIAVMTVVFALGQALGPLLSGAVSDSTGHVALGLWTSPVLLGLATLVALRQRSPPP